ncbi:hypothetical protein LTR51_005083 [Lithohypha guttulata]|nr:hypothetical protein LTR51_005083 [Lithohypha guttulata]
MTKDTSFREHHRNESDDGGEAAVPSYVASKTLHSQIDSSVESIESDGRIHFAVKSDGDDILDHLGLAPNMIKEAGQANNAKPTTSPDCTRPPKMAILMLAVGSRGDIQPFIALALALQRFGHRIRLATHSLFQPFVEEYGIEFFDLGGDPRTLMSYMVENPGLMPGFVALHTGEVGARRKTMQGIIYNCWHACFRSDQIVLHKHMNIGSNDRRKDVSPKVQRPFVADAIIANPPALGHIHCAEALGVPLHIFFTMPWSPTKEVAHPLANVRSNDNEVKQSNLLSYLLVEGMIWQGLGSIINRFRFKYLALDPIHPTKGPMILHTMNVPHSYCWSPSLLPKPKDWAENLAVTGYTSLDALNNYAPSSALVDFLAKGSRPIFVGFGSIVLGNPEEFLVLVRKTRSILQTRMVLALGWSGLEGDIQESEDLFVLRDDCPHEWLFAQVACVVHHGGAGTTAAGLRAGVPTVTVPFFGDQFFWGDAISRAGAGPQPIPYKTLTAVSLSQAILSALSQDVVACAKTLGARTQSEDGELGAVENFHACLPNKSLCCALTDRAACWRLISTTTLLSPLAATVLRKERLIDWDKLELHRSVNYDIVHGPYDPLSGAAWAVTDLIVDGFRGMGEMIAEVAHVPIVAHRATKRSLARLKEAKIGQNPAATTTKQHTATKAEMATHKHIGGYMLTGILRISKAAIRAPGAFTSAMAQGSHDMPRLWGDTTVRPTTSTTGVRSGISNGCKELVLGVYDGTAGLFVQPVTGLINGGLLGLAKGTAKGLLGFPIKFFAAANGIVGHPLRGIDVAISRALKSDGMKAIKTQRMLQGEYEFAAASETQKHEITDKWYKLVDELGGGP